MEVECLARSELGWAASEWAEIVAVMMLEVLGFSQIMPPWSREVHPKGDPQPREYHALCCGSPMSLRVRNAKIQDEGSNAF